MTDYTPIAETETNPGAPGKSSLWKRWSKNCIAMFEGALGAPRLLGEAVARAGNGLPVMTIQAADTYDLLEGLPSAGGSAVSTSPSDTLAWRWTVYSFAGSLRLRLAHAAGGGGWTSTVSLYKNGALVASYNNGTQSPIERVIDIAIAVGDVLEWRHRGGNASYPCVISSVAVRANNAYIPQSAFRRAV